MSKRQWTVFAGLCGLMTLTLCAAQTRAQEVKPKPPMFTYVANWTLPADHWADANKAATSISSVMDKAIANGDLVGYGHDKNLVHTLDGETHDSWWSSMSMAGLVKTLDVLYATGLAPSPAMSSATKHWDHVYVSRYYNWKSGAYKDSYVHVSVYKLKADAPDDAQDQLSQHMVVPLLEKLLADGAISEYEIDSEAIHTDAPGTFAIVYVTPTPDGLDKVQSAIIDTLKAHPLLGQAFGSMTDDNGHRDELIKGDGVFK